MKKIFIILFVTIFISSCNNTNNNNNESKIDIKSANLKIEKIKENIETDIEKKQENTEKTLEEKVNDIKLDGEEYGDLKGFIKEDLDKVQKDTILTILKQRKERQKEIEKIFNDILENGGFKEKFEKIKEMRKTCMNRILPYVKDDMKEKFVEKCEKGNEILKIMYYKSPKKVK